MPQIFDGTVAGDGTGLAGPRNWIEEINRTKLEVYNARYYGAKGDGVTDDTTALLAWIAAVPTGSGGGGILYAPRGEYLFGSTIDIDNKRIWLMGDGPGSELNTNLGATTFTKKASLSGDGIRLSGHAMGIQNITLRGLAGNGGDGISIQANYQQLRDVSVFGMGNDGIRAGVGSSNVNCFKFMNVISRNNTRHGCNLDDGVGGINGNVGLVYGLECSNNGGDGLFVDNCFGHTFYNVLTSSNTGSGVHLGAVASLHTFYGGDLNEGNGAAQDLLLDAGSLQNHFYGSLTTRARVTDNGTENVILTTRLLKMPYLVLGRKATTEAVLVSGVDSTGGTTFDVAALTAARVVGLPLTPVDGQELEFLFLQDGTGGRNITWNAGFVGMTWSNVGNVANAKSSQKVVYNGTNWRPSAAQSPWAV